MIEKGKAHMNKTYGLTNTEMQIMELLWQAEKPMTFREIMSVAVNEWKKTWKVQTLSTYLANLQRMGMIEAAKGATPYNAYYAACTKEQHIHNWTKKMVKECYGNSISRLMCAFIGEGALTEEEAEELRKLL